MAVPAQKLTLKDFMAWENAQADRNEFYCGEVFAMVGARRVHGLIGLNLASALKSHLKGSACRAFVADMKIQVADNALFYPDVFVTCDAQDLKTELVFRQPKLIVEVLSPSTEAFDRGLKFAAYRQIDALQEYLLIDPDTRRVEVYRRNERDSFELHDQTGRAQLQLTSVDLTMAMSEVFDGVEDAAVVAAAADSSAA
jgi:Uma2 family endonuclease